MEFSVVQFSAVAALAHGLPLAGRARAWATARHDLCGFASESHCGHSPWSSALRLPRSRGDRSRNGSLREPIESSCKFTANFVGTTGGTQKNTSSENSHDLHSRRIDPTAIEPGTRAARTRSAVGYGAPRRHSRRAWQWACIALDGSSIAGELPWSPELDKRQSI
jgi:hypothetical protein